MENNNTNVNCNFCGKDFVSKSNLNLHQKTAKYCLEKQGKEITLVCSYCSKKMSSKQRLDDHLKSCNKTKSKEEKKTEKEKFLEKENKDLRESYERQINDLKESYERQIKNITEMLDKANNTISEIAKQPKNTTNIKTQNNTSNINNILTDYKTYEENTNRDHILSLVNEEDIEEYFWKGQRGVAEFVCDRIAKTKDGKMIICCTDPTRNRFKYKNESNGISEDIDAYMFHKKISDI